MKTYEKYLTEASNINGKIKALKTVMKSIFDELSDKVKYFEGRDLIKSANDLALIEEYQEKYYKALIQFLKN